MASEILPAGGKDDDLPYTFSTSDDNVMMKQIQATHTPDGREFDVKLLLYLIEDILHHATPPNIPGLGVADVSCNLSTGLDVHTTTMTVLNTLSSYTWDAKVVIALAAFAVNYGQFWLVLQVYQSDPLANCLALLRQLPDMFEPADSLKPKFEALIKLIKAMLDATKCIFKVKKLPYQYMTPVTPEIVTATEKIPAAIYWIIRSSVVCASHIMDLISIGRKGRASTTDVKELSSLGDKIRRDILKYFEEVFINNTKILKALFYAMEDQLPLVDGSTRRRVTVDVLMGKQVLLLISDLDLSHEEHFILHQMYTEARQHEQSQYEVVWLPVTDRTILLNEVQQKKFSGIQAAMPWFSVYHHSLLDPTVITFIKKVWHFNKKPLLVVLDQSGRVVNLNAMHMMWIWGNSAFPFSRMREEELWMEVTWTIELLAGHINESILDWIENKKYICFYGGESLDWIRRFTKTAQAVAEAAQIPLETLYVGKSNPSRQVLNINNVIAVEKLSHILPDLILIWFFWARLESMWLSKTQLGKSAENDPIMNEIMRILSFDVSDQGWAVISRGGTDVMAKAKGDAILQSLIQFEQWKDRVGEVDFVTALNDHIRKFHTPYHSNCLILPSTAASIPERRFCVECGRLMEAVIMYRVKE